MKKYYLLGSVFILSGIMLFGCGQEVSSEEKNNTEEIQSEIVQADSNEISSEEASINEENLPLAYGEMNEDFYYYIEDTFALVDRNDLVVVGINHNSPIYPETEVDILSTEGRIQTSIGGIEVYSELKEEGIPEETNAGLMLMGVTKEQVSKGDLLVLRDCGVVSDKVYAVANITSEEYANNTNLLAGEIVQIIQFDTPTQAVVESIENYSEEVVVIFFSLDENIAYVNHQMFRMTDKEGNEIGVGYLMDIDE